MLVYCVREFTGGMMLEKMTMETFEQVKGTHFELTLDDGKTLPLELAKVLGTGLQGLAKREQFSLHFVGPATPELSQRIYRLLHSRLGTLEIFLVPIQGDSTGRTYEAVFT